MSGFLEGFPQYAMYVPLLLRLLVGVNFFVGRGIRHLITGRSETIRQWKGQGMPAPAVVAAALLNFFGALCLILGFLVPVAASLFAIEMACTAYLQKFKMKTVYFGHGRAGYELNIVYLIISIVLIVLGGGAFSIDALTGF